MLTRTHMGRQGFGVGDYEDFFWFIDWEFGEDKEGMEILEDLVRKTLSWYSWKGE